MLKINDKWLWDFWFAKDNNEYHIFYLQAQKSLQDERRRHYNATIGHAVSNDLVNWKILPDALKPSKMGAWDDLATWTGSVIKKDDKWYMFYTGVNNKEKGLIQRIGVAVSDDLINWEKHDNNPIIVADCKRYEMLDLNSWHDHAWRDPFVFLYGEIFYALITARVNYGPADERGVIALADSSDLINWNVQSPISKPGDFGQLEVPQLLTLKERNFIVFSTAIETTAKSRKHKLKDEDIQTGIFYLESEQRSPISNYVLPKTPLILGDQYGSLYSGKIVEQNGNINLFAFHNYNRDGEFLGYLSDPIVLKDFLKP